MSVPVLPSACRCSDADVGVGGGSSGKETTQQSLVEAKFLAEVEGGMKMKNGKRARDARS